MLINQTTKATPAPQALRLGLLAGQALERSDNPAIIRRNVQPLRVGLSKSSAYQLIIKRLLCVLAGSLEMLTFAYARARSALGSIIHQLNLYHND